MGWEERGQRVTQVSAKSHEGRNKVQGLGGPPVAQKQQLTALPLVTRSTGVQLRVTWR